MGIKYSAFKLKLSNEVQNLKLDDGDRFYFPYQKQLICRHHPRLKNLKLFQRPPADRSRRIGFEPKDSPGHSHVLHVVLLNQPPGAFSRASDSRRRPVLLLGRIGKFQPLVGRLFDAERIPCTAFSACEFWFPAPRTRLFVGWASSKNNQNSVRFKADKKR